MCLGLAKIGEFSSTAGYCNGVDRVERTGKLGVKEFSKPFSVTHPLQTSFPIMAYMTMAGWSNSWFLDKLRNHRWNLNVKHLEA